jgi:hypothetical protein
MADISQRLAPLRPYLVETRCAVLTTLDPDGSPHPAVVHYQLEDDAIVVNGRVDRRGRLRLAASVFTSGGTGAPNYDGGHETSKNGTQIPPLAHP